jgi:DNA primase
LPISRDTIELIRERSRIEEIVRRYVPSLKKRGANFVGLCPFHKEKTPSFTVSPEKQIFYCFGCHTGGNVYAFISKLERLNFPESVRFLGNLAGIEVREERDDGRAGRFDYLKRINAFAMNVYHQALYSDTGRAAREYVTGRGVTVESIKEFKIGFAPDSWNYLSGKLESKNVSLPQAVELGLVAESTKGGAGRHYDRFRNRLMFPIFDQKGDAIAFGGRVLGEGEPKYLNSPESDLFRKGSVLYGFNLAREQIMELKRAIVVEGYLDVIGCFQNGVRNVVAPLGTALTAQHIELLSRYCTEIILLFDADSAGMKASLRSLDVVGDKNIEVKVALLPESDPFEFITKKGIRPFMAVVDSALHPVEFRIQRVIAGAANAPRVKVLMALFGVIDGISFDTEKQSWLKRISALLGLDERSLVDDYSKYTAGGRKPGDFASTQEGADDRPDFLTRCHRDLVLLLLNHPDIVDSAVLDFTERGMSDPVARSIFSKIAELYAAGEPVSIDRMFDIFQEGDERAFLEKSLGSSFTAENPGEAYSEIYVNVKLYWIDRKIDKLMGDIKGSGDGSSGESLAEVEVLRRDKEKLLSFLQTRR